MAKPRQSSIDQRCFLPSQEHIRDECSKIRSTWSPMEHEIRMTGMLQREVSELRHWTPPEVSVPIDRDRHLAE